MEDLRELVKLTGNDKVKEKILELIQAWAHAFRNDPNCKAVGETLNLMKAEGFKFPALKESDAMFSADSAPQWADSDCCHRCRVQFSLVQRKHHCRCCGQIFCGKCSGKQAPIPKFGIEREVRVCEDCFDKLTKPSQADIEALSARVMGSSGKKVSTPSKTAPASATAPAGKTEQELREEEELQLALAVSLSEAEAEQKKRQRTTSLPIGTRASSGLSNHNSPGAGRRSEPGSPKVAADPEMARYLDRDYWQGKAWMNDGQRAAKVRSTSPAPSAPSDAPQHTPNQKKEVEPAIEASQTPQDGEALTNGDASAELNAFLNTLRSALEIFVNRMNSNKLRGRPIGNDTAVQSLFMNITNMHTQLLQHISQQDDKRLFLEGLQDKISQIRDARSALDALREEHQEKLRLEAEEAERVRQAVMTQKLEVMRQKKHEFLQYQRQLALQRLQDQEREMQSRKEQYMWQQNPTNYQPQISQQQQYAMPTSNLSAEASPFQPPQLQQQHHQPAHSQAGGYQQPPQYAPPASSASPYGPPMSSQHHLPPQNNMYQAPPQYTTAEQPNAYLPQAHHQPPPPQYQQQPQQPPHGHPSPYQAPVSEAYSPYNMQSLAQYVPNNVGPVQGQQQHSQHQPPPHGAQQQQPQQAPGHILQQGPNTQPITSQVGPPQQIQQAPAYNYQVQHEPQPIAHDPNSAPLISFD